MIPGIVVPGAVAVANDVSLANGVLPTADVAADEDFGSTEQSLAHARAPVWAPYGRARAQVNVASTGIVNCETVHVSIRAVMTSFIIAVLLLAVSGALIFYL